MTRSLVEYVIKQIARTPDEVEVTEQVQDNKRVISVRVSDQDRGRVVGREGRTIRALRTLVNVAAPEDEHTVVTIRDE